MKKFALFAVCLLSFSLACKAAKVTVQIKGVQKNSGQIRVGLFSADQMSQFPNGKPFAERSVPVKADNTSIIFDSLPAGTYAIGAYNDANNNSRLDKVLGIPKEQYGNSGKRTISEPTFAKSKFDVGNEDKLIEFDLH